MGGFECSAMRRQDGRQLDLLAATRHDILAADDYGSLLACGIRTVRDGIRWHLIEREKGVYDWSSALPMLRAARATGMQVIWDLCHYGIPHWLDIAAPTFPASYGKFAAAAARVIAEETGAAPILCPMNEISFWAWAGGTHARLYPHARINGGALKRQLVAATIAAIDAIRAALPEARFTTAEPLIHVTTATGRPSARARAHHDSQYEATDMVAGRQAPELGGSPAHLDIIGVNFYCDNEWILGGPTLPMGHRLYVPLSHLLREVHARYARPLLITETGAEGASASAWLRYVASETRAAQQAGVPILGLCLYPILDYPGWENNRHCRCGLLEAAPDWRTRRLDRELLAEIREQADRFAEIAARAQLGLPASDA